MLYSMKRALNFRGLFEPPIARINADYLVEKLTPNNKQWIEETF